MPRDMRALIAAGIVTTWSLAAGAEPGGAPLDAGLFDRCSTSTGWVGLQARRSRYEGVDGFDARGCPVLHDASMPEATPAPDAAPGAAVRGRVGALVNVDDAGPVASPGIVVEVGDRARRWRATASYGADIVTHASADVISGASAARSVDVRHVGTLAAEAALGPARLGLDGGFSSETGDAGATAGAAAHIGLPGGRVALLVAYHFGFDRWTRVGTPSDVFHRDLLVHTIDAGASVLVAPATRMDFVATASLGNGDTSTPDQFVLLSNMAVDLPEQLPTSRHRFAVLGRVDHRFGAGALRVDERVYVDTWRIAASTTDARSWHDVTTALQLGPHARFHIQSGADFWQRAYQAKPGPTGLAVPPFRTTDQELSPLLTAAAGGGLRWAVSRPIALHLLAEGVYTRFLDVDRDRDRWGFAGTAMIEVRSE